MTRDEVFQYLSLAEKNKGSQSLFIMEQLLFELGSPEQKVPAVHLAGTNGKGSTARLLESCLREAGYKTGLYTSPHVLCFSERIRVNGENISKQELCSLTQKVQSAEAKLGLRLNYFQIVTA
ncbi:MAG TPA: bifunctional folylpolyglutamate synthase/dihydrofolate synthase, partial [Clostridia bacterium]|nr:bifunctional folylpolyglutamate synthase/dihydrofolate synthase [Clostridia bacterium]